MTDLTIWEGDGLPSYEQWKEIVDTLVMTTAEQEAWLDGCKREAWVREKMSKYDTGSEKFDSEWHLATCRYFWRRVDTLKKYITRYSQELDKQLDRDKSRHKLRDSSGRFTKANN
jgi:hypothetical protein